MSKFITDIPQAPFKNINLNRNELHLSTIETLDDVPDGAVGGYSRVKTSDISAGHILLSEAIGTLDNIDDGAAGGYSRVKTSEISTGFIKLTTNTVWSGKVVVNAGITIDSASGINMWGLNNALTTRATETGAIQCYV